MAERIESCPSRRGADQEWEHPAFGSLETHCPLHVTLRLPQAPARASPENFFLSSGPAGAGPIKRSCLSLPRAGRRPGSLILRSWRRHPGGNSAAHMVWGPGAEQGPTRTSQGSYRAPGLSSEKANAFFLAELCWLVRLFQRE